MGLVAPDVVAELDRTAFEACERWHSHVPTDLLTWRGIHLGPLLRQHLWSKVGRTLRARYSPEETAFELEWIGRERRYLTWGIPANGRHAEGAPAPRFSHAVKETARRTIHRLANALGRPALLVPVLKRTGPHLLQALAAQPGLRLVTWPEDQRRFSLSAVGWIAPGAPPPEARLRDMGACVVDGLAAEGIELLPFDRANIRGELALECGRIDEFTRLLERVRPRAVMLQADDVSPPLAWVSIARRLGIPSLVFKHGLDCEHRYHSQAYADGIMVWGPERAERYRRESVRQPRWLEVTGNPEYGEARPPQALDRSGSGWVWVTRPHDPMKCYAPSRHPVEGVRILRALQAASRSLSRREVALTVKPHPTDLLEAYRNVLDEPGNGPVRVVHQPLGSVLPGAGVVISEDSTAALDAMLLGKVLVHVHFAPSPPVLPLVEYGAALPGFTPAQLGESLEHAATLSPVEAARMWEGQQRFIRDYAGPLDGRQSERAVEVALRVVEESRG